MLQFTQKYCCMNCRVAACNARKYGPKPVDPPIPGIRRVKTLPKPKERN